MSKAADIPRPGDSRREPGEVRPKGGLTLDEIGEFGLIARIRDLIDGSRPSAPSASVGEILLGIGDDAAVVRPDPGWDWIVTCDVQVAERHFVPSWSDLQTIGRRAAMVNLSDAAAMGAEPRHLLVSLGLPRDFEVHGVEEFYRGLLDALRGTGAAVIGGNISGAGPEWFCDVTLIGRVEPGRALRRSGARPGDRILVTGHPGRSAAGLAVLRKLEGEVGRQSVAAAVGPFLDAHPGLRPVVETYLRPEARLAIGRLAVRGDHGATAGIDLSDGLVADLGHICQESGMAARIDVGRLPADPALQEAGRLFGRDPWFWPLSPGDDYELLLTLPPHAAARFAGDVTAATGIPVTDLGRIVDRGEPAVRSTEGAARGRDGVPPVVGWVEIAGLPEGATLPSGWDHFRSGGG